jgi:hypothetical protein
VPSEIKSLYVKKSDRKGSIPRKSGRDSHKFFLSLSAPCQGSLVNISIVADFTKSIAGSRPVGRYFSKIIKRRFTGSSPVCRNDPALENCARPPHLLAGSTSPSSAALRFLFWLGSFLLFTGAAPYSIDYSYTVCWELLVMM